MSRSRGSAIDHALDAVRAQADGRGPDEIRQLLEAELFARGIDLPETLIRAAADILAHPHGLAGQVRSLRFGWRAMAAMASHARALSGVLAGGDPGAGAITDPAAPASAWTEVVLDDHGKAVLRSRRIRLGLPAHARDQVAVRLKRIEMTNRPADAYVDAERIGTVAPAASPRFLAAMTDPHDELLTLGLAVVGPDNEPELRIAIAE